MFHVLLCLLMWVTIFDRSILPHIIDHFFARKFKLSERIHKVGYLWCFFLSIWWQDVHCIISLLASIAIISQNGGLYATAIDDWGSEQHWVF